MWGPVHLMPLLDGIGRVQVLVLIFKQPLLHGPQFPHEDQPPLTEKRKREKQDFVLKTLVTIKHLKYFLIDESLKTKYYRGWIASLKFNL